jgi:photosystem II stability/assembly factor-like uncharacterized protein
MYLVRFLTALFCILNLPAFSQWTWLNPLPQGHELNCSWFFNSDTGFVAGDDGTIMKTTDGGNSWAIKNLEGAYYLEDIFFTDHSTGYVIDEVYRRIFKTVNQGETWEMIYFVQNADYLNAITFSDDSTGYVVGYDLVLKTSDAGMTWTYQDINPPGYFSDVCFTATQTGYISSYNGSIYYTSDGGLTWAIQNTDPVYGLNGIQFTSTTTGYAYGDYGEIYKTTDGGNNWILYQDPDSISFFSFSSFNEDTLFVIGDKMLSDYSGYTVIYMSEDAGETWAINKTFTTEPHPGNIFCLRNGTAYCSGSLGSIYKTNDAGANWSILSNNITKNTVSCMDFPSADIGYASCTDDYPPAHNIKVLKTIDGGNTWFTLDSNFDNEIMKTVEFTSEDRGYIGGEKIYRTLDGGLTWSCRYSSTWQKMIQSIDFPNQARGVAVGGEGLILLTTNVGFSWTPVASGTTSTLYSVCMPDVDTGYAVGPGVFLKTVDGGNTWAANTMTYSLMEVYFVTPHLGYIVGDLRVLKTTDGGLNWDDVSPPNCKSPIRHVHFFDADTGYIAGGTYIISSFVYKTVDGGLSWEEEVLPNSHFPIECIYVTPANKVYASCWPGFLFAKSNDLTTGMPQPSLISNDSIARCFPNPFRSFTTITYTLKIKSEVNLSIKDASGKTVDELFDELQYEGTHEISYNGNHLKPGVYFYHIKMDDKSFTGKLLKIR